MRVPFFAIVGIGALGTLAVMGGHWRASPAISQTVASPADKFGSHMVTIDHVYDGDTFYFRMPGAWKELSMTGVRVLGIDAPEKRGRCDAERLRAKQATAAAEAFLKRGPIELRNVRWDKYGGRIEADVLVDNQSLATYMLSQHLAIAYNGEHRDKMEWCR